MASGRQLGPWNRRFHRLDCTRQESGFCGLSEYRENNNRPKGRIAGKQSPYHKQLRRALPSVLNALEPIDGVLEGPRTEEKLWTAALEFVSPTTRQSSQPGRRTVVLVLPGIIEEEPQNHVLRRTMHSRDVPSNSNMCVGWSNKSAGDFRMEPAATETYR